MCSLMHVMMKICDHDIWYPANISGKNPYCNALLAISKDQALNGIKRFIGHLIWTECLALPIEHIRECGQCDQEELMSIKDSCLHRDQSCGMMTRTSALTCVGRQTVPTLRCFANR